MNIGICPSTLQQGYDTYSQKALDILFMGKKVSHILPYVNIDPNVNSDYLKGIRKISVSGAQPKLSLVVEGDKLIYTPKGRQGLFILKPPPKSYLFANEDYFPANENLSMQLASQVYGIETAANGLCFFQNGMPAYITRRFDINESGKKITQEDFAALLNVHGEESGSIFKYINFSYEDCANVIKKFSASPEEDLKKFFRLVVFNFIILNSDAHIKNFSMIGTDHKSLRLSPAYDLINTSLHLPSEHFDTFALEKGLLNNKHWDNKMIPSTKRFYLILE